MQIQAPQRASRTYRQRLQAPPEVVFPLLCPVREQEWAEGWNPEVVYSHSGVVEPGCVFTTRDHGIASTWVTTLHDPAACRVEFVKVTPDVTACRILIALTPDVGGHTLAQVTYEHTAIGSQGEAVVAGFSEAFYERFMRAWEEELNRYLARSRAAS